VAVHKSFHFLEGNGAIVVSIHCLEDALLRRQAGEGAMSAAPVALDRSVPQTQRVTPGPHFLPWEVMPMGDDGRDLDRH
jgi:hypothetical protein